MLAHYLILNLPQSADDETIRGRYLELVKTYTPESDPVMFRRITAAYEALKDERRRIDSELFEGLKQKDWENELLKLAAARRPKPGPNPGKPGTGRPPPRTSPCRLFQRRLSANALPCQARLRPLPDPGL